MPKLDEIPRYLIRVTFPSSNCETNETRVRSAASVQGHDCSKVDIFLRHPMDAAECVYKHLNGRHGLPCCQSNLVSWTSSLLFALQMVFHRHRQFGESLHDIFLLIIDTSEYRRGFIRDMDLISAFSIGRPQIQKLKDLRERRHRTLNGTFYFGEYISQGSLSVGGVGSSAIVSAQSIINDSFWLLCSEFRSTGAGLANEVIHYRHSFLTPPKKYSLLCAQAANAAIQIGNLFGRKFRLPVTAMLLALRPWHFDVTSVFGLPRFSREF